LPAIYDIESAIALVTDIIEVDEIKIA